MLVLDKKPAVSDRLKELSKLTKDEWREYTKSIWYVANTRHDEHPAMFPLEIPSRLVKMFSFCEELVLDPFCGVGTTGSACLKNGRKFVGYDVSRKYIHIAKKELEKFKQDDSFLLKNGTSERLDIIPDSTIGLIVSSPPYWNKADYGSNKRNIGSIDNYGIFLDSTRAIFEECYRVLQPGRRMCLVTANVHQNTEDGLLTFPLSADFTSICRDIGFRLVNEIIWAKDGTGGKWGSHGKQRPIFGSYPYPPNFLFKNVHEYILIFKKPPVLGKNKRAPKYSKLMNFDNAPETGASTGQ